MATPTDLSGKRTFAGKVRTTRNGARIQRFAVQVDVKRWFLVEVTTKAAPYDQVDPETGGSTRITPQAITPEEARTEARRKAALGQGSKVEGPEDRVRDFLAKAR